MTLTARLRTPAQREHAKRLIDSAPEDYVMKLAEETRSDRQNRALWGYLKVLRAHDPDMAAYSPHDCKLRFLDALGDEMRYLPKLEGQGFFPVGHKSSTLTVEQFAALLTLIDAYAAKRGIELPRTEDTP